MPTYPDRVKKKKVKSLRIENFDQTSEKENLRIAENFD